MQIQFTESQIGRLAHLAALSGRETSEFVHEALEHFITDSSNYVKGVLEAEASIARGEFLTRDEMRAHFSRFTKA